MSPSVPYKMKIFYPFLLLTFVFWATIVSAQDHRSYYGFALYNVKALSDSHLEFLNHLWSDNHEELEELDVWQQPSQLDELIEVLVPPEARVRFEAELESKGIPFNITNENIQGAIEEELKKLTDAHRTGVMKTENNFNFSQYNTWNDIDRYLKTLPALFPGLVQLEIIGHSHEDRELILLKIGSNTDHSKKPSVWIDAGIHAREWIASATVLYIIDSILNYYDGDDTIQHYLDNIDWYFLPVMNPDGYAFSHAKDRMWRKNRSPAVCKARKCCQGVDLNRNYANQWGVIGASKNPCSEVYQGPKPFSEPETKAVRDFVLANANNLRAFFTFHSYGQLWLYPFAYKKKTYPEDVEELRKLSLTAVENMRAVHGSRYKVGTAANILYPASGGADDWAKGDAGIKYAFSIELRPAAGRGNGFILHPKNIAPSAEETWAGIRVVADKILSEGGNTVVTTTEPGPEMTTMASASASKTTHGKYTTTPKEEEATTVEKAEEENEECTDLSVKCMQFEDHPEKCNHSVVKALCRKVCKQC